MGKRTDSSKHGRARRPPSRYVVEALLERLLGKPKNTLRDIHTELMLADRQRSLLARVFSRGPETLFSAEEVELLIDAIQEYGECRLPAFLLDGVKDPDKYAPPPLTAQEIRVLIDVCALASGKGSPQFVAEIDRGLVAEQTLLRSAFVKTAPSAGLEAEAAAERS
jgi:hypothetical protein